MRIGFIALPKTLATGITLPCEMLHAASQMAHLKQLPNTPLALRVFCQDGESEQVTGGITLKAQGSWDGLLACDMVFMPPLWGNPLPMLAHYGELIDVLRRLVAERKSVIAAGTGVYFLAEGGVLNDRVATTHWYFFGRFARRYPKVLLKPKQAITYADEIYCAGSVNSLTDLVLYFVRQWYNDEIMSEVERHFSHEVSRTLHQPFYRLGGLQHDDEDIVAAQAWLAERLDKPFQLQELASVVGLTERTLARRFVQATGESPKQYWLQLRLQRAEELLRESNLTVQEIAELLGFTDASYFIKLFRQRAAVTPADYRNVVRAKQFSV